jgi:hypothetical protein
MLYFRSFLSKLDAPYSDCIKNAKSSSSYDSFFYKAMFDSLNFTTYRQKSCFRICLQEFIKNECDCVDGSLPNIWKLDNQSFPVCFTIKSLECVAQSRIEFFKRSDSESCTDCPLECESVNYQLSSSNSRYPTLYYLTYLRKYTNLITRFPNPNSVSDNQITKSTVLVNVFYDDLAITYTNEVASVTPVSLLGTIGGNLGLFVVFIDFIFFN